MEEVNKRQQWEVEETRFFLKLVRERKIMKCLDGKRFRSDDIFKFLEKPMSERGYIKTHKQMQTKFKTLRLQYNKLRREMNKSGSGNRLSTFLFADELNDLLESRPITAQASIDSTPTQNLPLSDNSNTIDGMYDNIPDPRDGAVPGCSTSESVSTDGDTCSSPASSIQVSLADDSESTGNLQSPPFKKRKGRSLDAVTQRYAQTMKDNYETIQKKIMKENQNYIQQLMESERQHEKDIINEMLQSQKAMLNETTQKLLEGLKSIFNPTTNIPISTIHPNSQQFVVPPQIPNHFQSQAMPHVNSSMCPVSPFRNVVLNLNRGTIVKNTSVPHLVTNGYSTLSKPREENENSEKR